MKKINNLIIAVILVISYILAIHNISNNILVRFLIDIASLPVLFVPKILKKFKIKISDNLEFAYLLFIFFAYFLGTVINFYDRISIYDTIMHFLSGVFEAYIAFQIIKDNKNSKMYNILFVLGFVSLLSVCWEIFEFTSSNLLDTDPQKVELTGVTDTMKDLIAALIGGILVIINYRKN